MVAEWEHKATECREWCDTRVGVGQSRAFVTELGSKVIQETGRKRTLKWTFIQEQQGPLFLQPSGLHIPFV